MRPKIELDWGWNRAMTQPSRPRGKQQGTQVRVRKPSWPTSGGGRQALSPRAPWYWVDDIKGRVGWGKREAPDLTGVSLWQSWPQLGNGGCLMTPWPNEDFWFTKLTDAGIWDRMRFHRDPGLSRPLTDLGIWDHWIPLDPSRGELGERRNNRTLKILHQFERGTNW